jgi:hypothetical protein
VDVQHPALELLHEAGGQDAHEAGQAQDVGPGGQQRFQQRRLEGRAVAAEGAVVDGDGGNAMGARLLARPLAAGSFEATSTGRAGWSPVMLSTSATMLDPPPEIRMATRFTAGGPGRSRLRPGPRGPG